MELPWHAAAVAVLVLAQAQMMRRFLADPLGRATWYSGFGVPLFVSGMMISAFAAAFDLSRGRTHDQVPVGGFGWGHRWRLGLVQAALGAIVVLTTRR